jgi:hypothetical protein
LCRLARLLVVVVELPSMMLETPPAAEPVVVVMAVEHLPLLQTAGAISADWAACQAAPQVTVPQPTAARSAPQPLAMP